MQSLGVYRDRFEGEIGIDRYVYIHTCRGIGCSAYGT